VPPVRVESPVSQTDGYAKCLCVHCGGHIEFPVEATGRSIDCPHCHWPITLTAAGSQSQAAIGGRPSARKKILLALGLAALFVIASGAVALLFVLKGKGGGTPASVVVKPLDSNAAAGANTTGLGTSGPVAVAPVRKKPPDPWHGLMAGRIAIEKSEDGRLIYAVGTLKNASDHTRFAVKVELDVFDGDNQKVGTATIRRRSIRARNGATRR